ncbi:MAG: mannonate dehydratase [Clostridiaceae bacterium]|jgi:mannonate dehydratase|nr:mannonate dehydratase [Bacillota bacterium]NLI39110.1 mannonate dehydratase [Clostridiaceae bacterium]
MKLGLRWFGTGFDSITLEQIRQIPGVSGVITTLYDIPAGDAWPLERIRSIKEEVESFGLEILGIESVNVPDAIKAALPERDLCIENYIKTLERLGTCNIRLVCYNFMPVFDWVRSDLAKPREDGATVLSYDQEVIDRIDPMRIFNAMDLGSNGFMLPGWEPERLAHTRELFEIYKDVDNEKLFENMVYFLKAVMPTCEKYGIKMAVHPDDPAWPVFGLPRIVTNHENLSRLFEAVNSPCNGITLCTGSLGSNPENNLPHIIRSLKGKVHFAHVRNLKYSGPRKFEESAHLSADGSLDIFEIMKAFYDIGFDGPFRPDHGRTIWGEKAMPGYGLFDRALGAAYLNGLWEAISKMNQKKNM